MDGQRGEKREAGPSQEGEAVAGSIKKPKTTSQGPFTCGGCNTVQPVENFYKKQRREGGSCKSCHNSKLCKANKTVQAPTLSIDNSSLYCHGCQGAKPLDCFNKKHSKPTIQESQRRCTDCLQKRKQENKLKREAEEQRRLEERKLQQERQRAAHELDRQRKLAKWGAQRTRLPTYAVPAGLLQEDHDCPGLEFKPSVPSNDWLVGTYDLIFFSTYGTEDDSHRTTAGALELKLEKDGKLCGKVAVDNSVKMDCYMHQDDVHICAERSSEDEGASLKFQITNAQDLSNLCADLEEFPVTLQVVAKQHAVPYRPEVAAHDKEHQQSYPASIPLFQDANQARAILEDYEQGTELKWMAQHLSHLELPIAVTKRIGSFATSKPPPVFLYEENDLWVEFLWESDFREGDHTSTLVARRRRE